MSRAVHLGARGRLGGGWLQGYGVHDLDLLLELVQDVEAVAAATEVGVSERPLGNGGWAGCPPAPTRPLRACCAVSGPRSVRALHRRPRCEEGLRVQAIFDALRTAGVGRCWVHCEPVLGMGSR
jgi:hypothetical protein